MNIGVIIIFYNNEQSLQNSCFFNKKLKFKHIDLCLVNNGSTDHTIHLLKEIKEKFQSNIEIVDIKKEVKNNIAIKAGVRYFKSKQKLKQVGFVIFNEIDTTSLEFILNDIELNSLQFIESYKLKTKNYYKQNLLDNLVSLINYDSKHKKLGFN